MNKKTCYGFSPLIIIIGIFILFFLGTGAYIIKRNPAVIPTPLVSISPIPALTFTPTPTSVAVPCVVGGCSGELCLPEDQKGLASICIYKPEFVCYKKVRCEVQQSGACGWTQTPELAACITKAKAIPVQTPHPVLCNPSIECVAPPPGCNYQGSSTCACGKLVCSTPFPTFAISPPPLPVVTPLPTPIMTPSQSPSATPISTPIPTPSQSPSISPSSFPVTALRIEADDFGFYPAGQASFPAGTRVRLIFAVRTSNVYYGGLDFRSSKFLTAQASPGQTATAEFTAESSFTINSYWPSSSEYKASLQVTVQ